MNKIQKSRLVKRIKTMADETGRTAVYTHWLELRQSSESGIVDDDGILGELLGQGDGVFWTWRPNEGRVFIKGPVKVLDTLEAIAALAV